MEQTAQQSARRHASTASTRQRIVLPPPLQWRGPWWAWQGLSLALTTLTAPTFLLLGALLAQDSRSDHPFFWASLLLIVAFGNAIAILRINGFHRRNPFASRLRLAARFFGESAMTGSMLFLFVGCTTGFLWDIVVPMTDVSGPAPRLLLTVGAGLGMAGIFGAASFLYAGILHACLAFRHATDDEF